MIWLSWRQFRAQAVPAYAAVVAFAVLLAFTGQRLVDLQRAGGNLYDQLTRSDHRLYLAGVVGMALVPAVIGAFWGAPLVARELEAGTHRLVWTQSVTRGRWFATKLGLTALATVIVVGVLTFAVTWWSEPLDGISSRTRGNLPARLTPVAFAMRGVVPIGYAVFAVAVGVAAGVLLRRTVPAMALTLAVFTVVQLVVPQLVRPHLLPPVQETVTISRANFDGMQLMNGNVTRLSVHTANPKDWVLVNETLDPSGQVIDSLPASITACGGPRGPAEGIGQPPPIDDCLGQLAAAGYHQRLTYQPAHRFWPLQWAELALFLALSALLVWFSYWWTRHRLS